jgi:NAD(P)-dependent dehydrogenase (short-subunit alcohol dehydrogenase family)
MSADITGSTAIVTGASRGFGRAIATALASAGVQVVGVARDQAQLENVHAEIGDTFTPVTADAADPVTAGQLIDVHRPQILVLNAGASPLMRPVHHHTWESFSRNWQVDARHAFYWTREALLTPLPAGSTVITLSSGAALRGSPLSGGYAGAKATIRFLTAYAAAESERAGLGIRFLSVLPQLTGATGLGSAAVAAYAARQGVDVATYRQDAGPALTTEQVGKAITGLVTGADTSHDAYLLTAAGLTPAP